MSKIIIRIITVLTLGSILSGCATAHKNAWTTSDGAQDKVIETPQTALRVKPEALNKHFFALTLEIKNKSDSAIDFDVADVKLKMANGEVLDQLTDQQINLKISGAMANAGMIAGGGYYAGQAASANVSESIFNPMIRSGKIPARSQKSGVVYFDGSKSFGNISILVLKPLASQDTEVDFQFKQ